MTTERDEELQKLTGYLEKLAVVDGLALRGERIVVPQELRERMVKFAHEGHQGILRTKQLLRAHVWFPGIDVMVEMWRNAMSCQATTVCNTSGPLLMTELPSGSWRKVSVDFVGPFLNKDMALVFWDQYVWYPVVEFTTSISADSFIPLFTRVFNMFGILKRLSRTMGSRLMDRNFQTLLRNRDSDIERSLLPGLRPMETENVFCRC